MFDWGTYLRARAEAHRFTSIGWTPLAIDPTLAERLHHWLSREHHGDMAWMARDPARRADPRRIVPLAKTMICVTCNYFTEPTPCAAPTHGRISRYARGTDYHRILLPRLRALLHDLCARDAGAEGIAYVDTGPVMEKPWAAKVGLGWQGKHTNLIDPHRGSWLFLGSIVTTLTSPTISPEQIPQSGRAMPTCGHCRRCIDICPTRAIIAPYQLDARRCISYLTIEHTGAIPETLRPLMGNHIYGCDLCQDVCPWNRFARPTREPEFQPRAENLQPLLRECITMTEEQFRSRFRHSPIRRLKRNRFLRNVAVALGNSGDRNTIPLLETAAHDPDPLIQEHARWALMRLRQIATPT
ncbi:MAG: tRNA epoxyqueuosine(34) reductase QueG [Deltaproteobacteria bacterium]|nr:tRNA epoxyqueuosine(34) reductase QueG [Deltaproteobacteria bacterium]